MSDSLNCALGCVRTYWSKDAFCSSVSCDLGKGCICCFGEMCYEFAVGLRNLNLGSGNFKLHDVMSIHSRAIKYKE